MEWYENKRGKEMGERACKETIQATQAFFRLHRIKSKLVGADFRSVSDPMNETPRKRANRES